MSSLRSEWEMTQNSLTSITINLVLLQEFCIMSQVSVNAYFREQRQLANEDFQLYLFKNIF